MATNQGMTSDQEIKLWRRKERQRLIAARLAVEPEFHGRWSRAIERELATLLATLGAVILGIYWPVRAEFDPRPLAKRLIARGGSVALPAMTGSEEPLEYRPWRPGIPLAEGIHGIPTPEPGHVVRPDAVLAPLVGFDAQNYRLGYGGGYFDRTLATLQPRPLAIGVGFEMARITSVLPQPHDIAMDVIVTEAGLYRRVGSP